MIRKHKWLAAALAMAVIAAVTEAQNPPRTAGVICEQTTPIPDFHLVERLERALQTQTGAKIMSPGRDTTALPGAGHDVELMLAWGQQTGCRYVVMLQIEERRLAARKQTSIPYLLSRYVVEGRLSGTYTLIDVIKGKVAGPWKLATRLTGPRRWQVADDYPDDPDLMISAPGKMTFLKNLEDKAVMEMMLQLQPRMRGR